MLECHTLVTTIIIGLYLLLILYRGRRCRHYPATESLRWSVHTVAAHIHWRRRMITTPMVVMHPNPITGHGTVVDHPSDRSPAAQLQRSPTMATSGHRRLDTRLNILKEIPLGAPVNRSSPDCVGPLVLDWGSIAIDPSTASNDDDIVVDSSKPYSAENQNRLPH